MIILGSKSPRRQELLKLIYPEFSVEPANADENITEYTDSSDYVVQVALRKGHVLKDRILKDNRKDDIIICADTIVCLDNNILGKPKDEADAVNMLCRLNGRDHEVKTAVYLYKNGEELVHLETTIVHVAKMSLNEIKEYVATGDPLDKAGAYGIQGSFARYIKGIEGDFFNVMGLPVHSVYKLLSRERLNMGNPIVTIKMDTDKEIQIELYPDIAPNTVNNFIYLINKGFYNNLIFHRVIKGFMIQGGCPYGTGTGGPGYSIPGEFSSNGFKNNLKHTRGVISMARAQHPDSAGSQFFIMHQDSPYLDGQYAAFGKVIRGMDVVDEIAKTPTSYSDKPLRNQKMVKVTVNTMGVEYPEPHRTK